MITYTNSLANLTADHLRGGFFVGWPHPPSPETHLRVLRGSAYVVLALDGEQVVGYITAITDGVLAAYIPHLEVLPAQAWKIRFRETHDLRALCRRVGQHGPDVLQPVVDG